MKQVLTRNKRIIHIVMAYLSILLVAYSTVLAVADENESTGFFVRNAQTKLVSQVYQLSANIEYRFSDNVLSAIQNGVPIIIVLEVEILAPRSYIWDKQIAGLRQRFHLQYHALSEQYIVENLNSGARNTFPTLHSALYNLRDVKALPIIDKNLLVADQNYLGRVRVRIELESLPVPLRLSAYITRSWWLGSEWFQWEL